MGADEDGGILIVDDESDNLELLRCIFAQEGIKVRCAADGKEALRHLEKRTFTLMITDLNMPGMDGFELARKARNIAPRMPIVMGTGDISPDIPRLAKEAGITEVFDKPFDLEKLLAVTRKTFFPEPATAARSFIETA